MYTTKNSNEWNTGGVTDGTAERFFQQPSDLGADLLTEGWTD